MRSYEFTLWSCLASVFAVHAVRNITVDDFDPRIIYSNPSVWTHENGAATLDRFNLTTSYTSQKALASIKFNGTAVYFISYGLPLPYPDTYQVTVDGQTESRSLRVNNESERAQFMAYWRTGLDVSTEHQILVSNPSSIPLNIDAFIITVPANSTMKNGFSPLSDGGTSDKQSNGGTGLTAGATAGIVVALIGGLLFGLLAVFGISYWRRQRKSRTQYSTFNPVRRDEEGGASAVQVPETRQAATGSVFPFMGVVGGAQIQQGGFRKDRNPNGVTPRASEVRNEMGEGATTISSVTSPHPLPSSPLTTSPPPYAS